MRENSNLVPLGYTLVREQKDVPIESKSEFRDVPELITTLLRLVQQSVDLSSYVL